MNVRLRQCRLLDGRIGAKMPAGSLTRTEFRILSVSLVPALNCRQQYDSEFVASSSQLMQSQVGPSLSSCDVQRMTNFTLHQLR